MLFDLFRVLVAPEACDIATDSGWLVFIAAAALLLVARSELDLRLTGMLVRCIGPEPAEANRAFYCALVVAEK